MAVANTKSTAVTNGDATPKVMNPLSIAGGVLREAVGTVEIAAADCVGSVFRMVRVHSSWRLSEVTSFNDAITSGTVFDLGFYQTAENGGAVANANAIADNISLASGVLTGTQLLWEGGSDNGLENIEKKVWEMVGGLTEDPNIFYDLCFTGDTPGSGAGTISLRVRYVANT